MAVVLHCLLAYMGLEWVIPDPQSLIKQILQDSYVERIGQMMIEIEHAT